MNLLDVNNLSVKFLTQSGTFTALKNISLTLNAGEILGIVGESGSGKSTLGNAIVHLLSKNGSITQGNIHFLEQDITHISDSNIQKFRGSEIGFIFQNPMTALDPLFTIGDQIVETLMAIKKYSKKQAYKQAKQLLTDVEITDVNHRLKQYPHNFSGGMLQRVVIAIALSCNPKMIIADEPTTALDVSVQDKVLNILVKLCKKKNVGVLLITHNMGVIQKFADRVVVMYKGAIEEYGDTNAILNHPSTDYTKELMAAVPPSQYKIDRFPLPNLTQISDDNENYFQEYLHSSEVASWAVMALRKSEKTKDILKVEHLSHKFLIKNALLPKNRRYKNVIKDVSFSIRRGMSFGLIGESGSGKSTIAKIITGIYSIQNGKIILNGSDISQMNNKQRLPYRKNIQMIFQNPYSSLNRRKRVIDIVKEPIKFYGLAKGHEIHTIALSLLQEVGMPKDQAYKFAHEFSGGQQQRISIARALASKPDLLICDEPTSALDVSIQAQILNLLKDIQKKLNLSILFISHDLPVIRQMCDDIAILKDGQIVENKETEHLFHHPENPYTQDLIHLMPIFKQD